MDCPNCGGIMIARGAGKYKCKFCGNEIVDKSQASAPSVNKPSNTNSAASTAAPRQCSTGSTVYENNINGVAEILCVFPGARSAGSGFLINERGYLITNTHVVTNNSRPCNDIRVRMAGQEMRARIIALGDNQGGHGSGVDLALLELDHVPFNAKVVQLANFENVRIGENVYVIGNSMGYGTCITGGIVSDKKRNVNGKMLMMTDCAINGGNSGGPIFNEAGIAIGVIVSSIRDAEGMNFAIPMDTTLKFIKENGIFVKVV